MITVYASDAEDFSGNGLCVLYPTTCPVEEVAGGIYDLEINHPMSEDGRWLFLQKGNLIKTLVPKRDTPFIQQSAEARPEHPEHIVWHVTAASGSKLYTQASTGYSSWSNAKTYTKGAKVNYSGKSYRWDSEIAGNATPPNASWKKITTGSKVQKKLKLGDEMIYLEEKDSTWSHVTVSDGTSGYIQTNTIAYLRTEPYMSAQPAYNTAVPPKRIRDQVFRIYDVTTDTEQHSIKALARHIFYDQRGNFVKTYNPAKASLQAALIAMSADLLNDHEFNYYTNLIAEISAEWALKNGVQVILDPEQGAAVKCSAQVVRDNYDVFLLENTGVDRGVVIESGKNLLGVVSNINDDNIVTRIMPYGTDIGGKMLLLPELHIDSQYIDNYPNDRAIPLQVPEAVEKAPSDNDPGMTKEQCYEKMRQAVQAKYDAGCDLPDFDIKVNFVQLGDTEEYKAYRELHRLYLYDIVTVKHGRLGLNYKAQVIGFVWDAAKKRYTGMTLGNVKSGADLGMIAGFQLPIGGISGTKLVPGSVGSMQLRELSVLAAHIGLAQIVNAHIQDATIDKAKVKDFAAEVAAIAVAKIGEAWIDTAWIDQLTANVVSIVTANIDTLITNNATINWAQIANLVAAVADITLAQIKTANIGWAQIKGLVADTALFTVGVSGQLYCADLMVTDANIESLSANKIAGGLGVFGKIMIMGQDGKMYELVVGTLGELTAQEKKLDGDNIGDYVLTDRNMSNGTLTSRVLNAQQIFGDSALVRQLIAQNIDANTLFANLGFINMLRTHLIQSDIGQYLELQSNMGIQMLVSSAIKGIEFASDNILLRTRDWSTKFWVFAPAVGGQASFGAYGTGQDVLLLQGGTSAQSLVWQSNRPAKPNTQYVLSAGYYSVSGAGAVCRVVEHSDTQSYLAIHVMDTATKDVVFTTRSDITKFTLEIMAQPGSHLYVGKLKLGTGNKGGWSPAPEDNLGTDDFESYRTQTAMEISDKVASGEYKTYKTQTSQEIASKVSSDMLTSAVTQLSGQISAQVSAIKVAGRNLIRSSWSWDTPWVKQVSAGGQALLGVWGTTPDVIWIYGGTSANTLLYQSQISVKPNTEHIFEAGLLIRTDTACECRVVEHGDSQSYLAFRRITPDQKSIVFTTTANTTKVTIEVFASPGKEVFTSQLLLAEGNKGGWSQSPYDPATSVQTSYIKILSDLIQVISGGNIDIQAGASFNMRAGSGANAIGISNNIAGDWFAWAGGPPESAPFRVKKNGAVYASNISRYYAQHFHENADPSYPAQFDIYIPPGTGAVQSVKFSFKATKYRAYSKSASSGGGSTSGANGTQQSNNTTVNALGTPHNHTLPTHTHSTPNHSHGLVYGIYEKASLPTSCLLRVDGTPVFTYTNSPPSESELDIKGWLASTNGVVNSGWHTITVETNDDARIVANVSIETTAA